jgi:hypothetical protein
LEEPLSPGYAEKDRIASKAKNTMAVLFPNLPISVFSQLNEFYSFKKVHSVNLLIGNFHFQSYLGINVFMSMV